MTFANLLKTSQRIFLDTAPVIYYVENNPHYQQITSLIFDHLDKNTIQAASSAVTLAECLVLPYRLNKPEIIQAFLTKLVDNPNVRFITIDKTVAEKAADIRARYNISLLDAFQVACAIIAGCDIFVTNDETIKRITELNVVVLSEIF